MACKYDYPIEIPLILFMFSHSLLRPIETNLLIYRTCYVILGYNKSDCALLGNDEDAMTKDLETLVQPTVNYIEMALRTSESAIPVILCMFIGSWSDKYGRKPFLILSMTGMMLSVVINTIFIYFEYLSPWYFVFSTITSMFTGGIDTTLTIITLYIADVTTSKNRVFRMGIYEATAALSILAANTSSSYILYATSYESIYIIATSLFTACLVYCFLLLPESLPVEKKVPTIKEIISMMNFAEILKPAVKNRKNNKRFYVLTILGLIMIYKIIVKGDTAVKNLFLRQKLHWTLTQSTLSGSYGMVVSIVGTIFRTQVLFRILKFKESHLILMSIVAEGTASVLQAISTNSYYIYAAYTLNGFSGLTISILRTLLSYAIAPTELGRIFATSGALNNMVGLVAGAWIYPSIYGATININSGIFSFVDLGIFIIMFAIMLNLMRYPLTDCTNEQTDNFNKVQDGVKPDIKSNNGNNNFPIYSFDEDIQVQVIDGVYS